MAKLVLTKQKEGCPLAYTVTLDGVNIPFLQSVNVEMKGGVPIITMEVAVFETKEDEIIFERLDEPETEAETKTTQTDK